MLSSRHGVRMRFTLLYGAALIVTVLLFSFGIYFFVQRALMAQIGDHLSKDMATATEFLKRDPNSLRMVAEHGPIRLFSVTDQGRSFIASHDWLTDGLDKAVAESGFSRLPRSVKSGNGKLYLVQSTKVYSGGRVFEVAVGHQESSVRRTLSTLALIILLILPISIAISLTAGYLIAGRVLAPVTAITRKAEEIGAENLSERLPVANADDEFGRLATVFNQTFGRIEDSFERLRRFTADASHELRTPLTAIRSIGETALHDTNGSCACQETIGSILEETDRLVQLVDALLQLSRADAGAIKLQREPLDLASLAAETVEMLSVLAEEKEQRLTLELNEHPVVTVDRTSVRQALVNLLDNAIKYTPPGSEIRITVGLLPDAAAMVEIKDSGPGIPKEDLDRIFDRFYRVDTGRARENGGAGLGLSIVKWAVEINGGSISVESELGRGSLFRLVFPK
jgi:heavy metal sensor kinase